MKIAVIGAGISGLGAALALSKRHDVTLIEKQGRFGGHANTVEVEHDGLRVAVDTGFIVYNQRNYPNLTALFEHLGVATQWSDMSFGFSLKDGRYEYACDDLGKIFAQKRNMANLRHLRMLFDVVWKFNRTSRAELADGDLTGLSLGDWLDARGYSREPPVTVRQRCAGSRPVIRSWFSKKATKLAAGKSSIRAVEVDQIAPPMGRMNRSRKALE